MCQKWWDFNAHGYRRQSVKLLPSTSVPLREESENNSPLLGDGDGGCGKCHPSYTNNSLVYKFKFTFIPRD